VTVDDGAISTATAAANELAAIDIEAHHKTARLAVQLGYDGPLEPDMLQFAVAQHLRQTVEAALGAGRALLLLKERVPYGDFLRRLEQLGVAARAGQKLMQAALKFSTRPTTAIAAGTPTKLLELLVLDDEDLQQLETDGSVLGIELDDIQRMGARELRLKLREAREDLAAKDDLVTAKNKKIDDLISKKRWRPGPDDIARNEAEKAALDEWAVAVTSIEVALRKADNVVRALYERQPTPAVQLRVKQGLEYAAHVLGAQIQALGIDVDLSAVYDPPAWIDDALLSAPPAADADA
jgi:hypothetical protein